MRTAWIALLALNICCFASAARPADLQRSLTEFISAKNASIGVAVIIDGKDTVAVNGHVDYPMLSVYKLPIALALADKYRQGGKSFDELIPVTPRTLRSDTYSPMTDTILAAHTPLTGTVLMPARELLSYMLRMSDNNASDIILHHLGGPSRVSAFLESTGIDGIHVRNSEEEMYSDIALCYANSSTPLAMAKLFDYVDCGPEDTLAKEIRQMLETCTTGTGRLPAPLSGTDALIGHKTGTGFTLPDGTLMAVNDAAYVHLPDGHRYSISVFIRDSPYDMEPTEALIAEISRKVMDTLSTKTNSAAGH